MDTSAPSTGDPERTTDGLGRASDSLDQRREQGSESDKTIDAWGPDLKLRGVAHDMTNPAATLRFLAQLLSEESSDPRVQQVAAQIQSEAAYLLDLCTDVLEGGHIEEIRVDQLASRIVERNRLVSDVQVTADLRPATLRARSVSIERLISNLLANALRAAGNGGRARVEVAPSEGGVTVIVADSGPGFPEQPVGGEARLSANSKTPRRALGLLIVDGIVRQYEGTIDIGRSDLGGALVSAWLPSFSQRRGGTTA
jgi:two-component system, NtrC family, sensor histidine kinase HydH